MITGRPRSIVVRAARVCNRPFGFTSSKRQGRDKAEARRSKEQKDHVEAET